MVALRLAGESAAPGGAAEARVAALVRSMLALQGQDWRGSTWAIGSRLPGATLDDVHAAFNGGQIVRSWPMRGTIHVVAAEDIGWMQRLTGEKTLRTAPKRRETLGMSDAALERLVEISQQALAASTGLTREELSSAWTEAGVEWQPAWRYHLVWWLCQNGMATLGPVPAGGGEPLIVLASDWIKRPRELAGDEALAEFATRYAAARGPVTAKDLGWWSGLGVRDAKRGLQLAAQAGLLVQAVVDQGDAPGPVAGQHWVSPAALDALRGSDAAPSPDLLLAPFDEHLLGYTERGLQLAPAHFDAIVPGKNGMFKATVVRSGVTVGTWARERSGSAKLVATPLPGHTLDAAELAPQAAGWGAFHGVNASITVGA